MIEALSDWASSIHVAYGVDPWVFIGIYLATLPFTWWIFFKILFALKVRDRKLIFWIALEILLIVAPYIYILLFMRDVSYLVRIVIILFGVLLIIGFLRRKKDIAHNTLWDSIAGDYNKLATNSLAHQEKNGHIAKEILTLKAQNVLDVGCGSCVLERLLLQSRFKGKITAIDSSVSMLAIAKQNVNFSHQVDLLEHDLNQPLPFNNGQFDFVVSINSLFCIEDRLKHIKEVCRVMESGACLMLVSPKPIASNSSFIKKQLAVGNIFMRIGQLVKIFLSIPSVIRLIVFDRKLSREKGRYMSLKEIEAVLRDGGFHISFTGEIQEGQNFFIKAYK